ncbi:Serine/Threonine-kinase RIO1-like protein [Medicago truncatula]|uniref:Serine/threonine-protein kinase RIO1 n=1 Tax=Medicago truncatula TaxID=3880 RepID=G7L465_MEDTR|nr:Serine/Threonine-kinase RIO1-like protein [Medicago truncatula]
MGNKEDDDELDYEYESCLGSRRPNAHGGRGSHSSTLQPLSNRNQRFSNRIRASPLEEWEGRTNIGMSNTVTTEIRGSLMHMSIGKTKTTGKVDRATVENAIDLRTRMAIFKMINNNLFQHINGCISTGKEANVYHATDSDGQEYAIKIHKTSVLGFKDRNKYVKGDRRFERAYCSRNPREMGKTWAEKELKNLYRIAAKGIRCPKPRHQKLHMVVMDFIGKDGWAAPRLKDADLSLGKLLEGYVEIIVAMRDLYQKCRLVHGDLSEYNILYYEGHLYIIDVSQAVDIDHPCAHCLLFEDCKHVSDFFKKHGVGVMTKTELFKFIVNAFIADDDVVDSYLEKSDIANTLVNVKNAEEAVQLIKSTIDHQKQKLDIRDYSHVVSDDKSNLLEGDVAGEDEDNNSDSKEISSSESDPEEISSFESFPRTPIEKSVSRTPIEKKDDRKKARKESEKKMKEKKREKRKTKISKAAKKRRIKLTKAPKTR